MKARPSFLLLLAGCLLALLLAAGTPAGRAQAQANPTPIVIDLTPTPTATATAGPAGVAPDGLEPNDAPAAAAPVGLGMLLDLTLTEGDADYFTGYAKAGQTLEISTWVDGSLDTRLTLFWQETVLATSDDRSPTDLGSTVTFTAPADGAYLVLVERAGVLAGGYALEVALVSPTPTQTPAPTASPTSTPTPLLPPDIAEPNNDAGSAFAIVPGARYQLTVGHGDIDVFRFLGKAGNRYSCQTVTTQVDTLVEIQGSAGQLGANDDRGPGRVDSYAEFAVAVDQTIFVTVSALGGSFGPYEFGCDFAVAAPPAGGGSAAAGSPMATPTLGRPAGSQPTLTATTTLSASHLIPLTVRPLADDLAGNAATTTAVRLL
ncbi:MAG: PPC domain-containing protein, partial [Anaerolineales bacterium]|nr:PPC domain-containing protein [Anaerolineales bacterium]